MSMRISARNFLGVIALDLDLVGVTLLAGQNASGKSSVIEATACVATSTALARGIATKKAGAESLLHEGEKAGAITLSDETAGWARRIDYPGCAVRERGSVPPLGSRLALGLDQFGAMARKERAATLGTIFGLDPTLDDFTPAIRATQDIVLMEGEIAALWKRIESQGWDAVARSVREDGAKLKGRWEQVTGRRYGAEVARTWCPTEIDPAETYDLDAAESALSASRRALDDAFASGGAVQGERERLQTIADTELVRAANVRDMQAAVAADDQKLTALRDKLVAAEREARETAPLECPHCHQAVRLSSTANSIPVLIAASARPARDPKESAREVAAIRQEGVALRTARDGLASALAKAEAALAEAVAARETLAGMPEVSWSGVDVESARAEFVQREALAAAIAAHSMATDLARQITESAALVAILDPSGLRATCAARGIAAVNEAIAEQATRAGWKPTTITADLDLLYGGRPYQLCSESERWRADLAVQCAVAHAEGAGLVLVDRLDVLAPQDRGSALKLLAGLGTPSIVACTTRDQSQVPDLARHGTGQTMWLDAGRAADVKKKAA